MEQEQGQGFGFDRALQLLKEGNRVYRSTWKNLKYIFLVDGSSFEVNRAPLNKFFAEGTPIIYRPHIDGLGIDGVVGTWSPSMVDLMEQDWYLYQLNG